MATENSFYLLKRLSPILLTASLVGCQLRQVKEEPTSLPTPPPALVKAPPADTTSSRNAEVVVALPPPPPPVQMEAPQAQEIIQGNQPKMGLILGPGALRTYAHIGVLQEFAKARLPIRAVVGYEMGALVAALYATKGQAYDVEWQMMKLKEDQILNKSLLGGRLQPTNPADFVKYLTDVFGKARSDEGKMPFACPAFNLAKQNIYLMSKGIWTQLLPYCLAAPPLFATYQQNVASTLELKSAVDFLKARGINYIVYVNLLQSRGDAYIESFSHPDNVFWSISAYQLSRPQPGIDLVVQVPLFEFAILDFAKRREMVQRGSLAGQGAAQLIIKKLGL